MIETGEKIGDFHSLAETSNHMSGRFEELGDLKRAIAFTLKALEYSRKTDTEVLQPQIYAFLTRQYARIGDLEKANRYFDKLMKISPKVLSYPRNAPWVALAEAVLFAAQGQWKDADQRFQKAFEIPKTGMWQHLNLESSPIYRKNYIWALELQGRTEEAKIQRKRLQKTTIKKVKIFAHADLQADLIMKKRIIVDDDNDILFTGVPDGIFIRPDSSYIIVDYKTARYTVAQGSLFPMYEIQLNGYALIGNERGFGPVSDLALVYMEPVTDKETTIHDGNYRDDGFALGFSPKIHRVDLNPGKIYPLLAQVREIYEMPGAPDSHTGCKNCESVEAMARLVNGILNGE